MFRIKYIKNHTKGFSLVELIVALAIFAILAGGVFSIVTNSYRNFYGTGDKQVVTKFAQEGIEAIRSIRDNSWQDIENATGANGISKNASGYWELSGSSNTLSDLTRVLTFSSVNRDANDEIVSTGGSLDPNTKKVTVTVSGTGMSDYILSSYITNWENKVWEQTDWSGIGDREFLGNATMASSSFSNISTSTAGEITLPSTGGGGAQSAIYGTWTDFAYESNYARIAWRPMYDMEISPDAKTLYINGHTNTDLRAYDIEKIRSGIWTYLWTMPMNVLSYSMKIHSGGRYMYVGDYSTDNSSDPFIQVIDLENQTTVDTETISDAGSGTTVMDMFINAAETVLYVATDYNGLYAFNISADGSTLTIQSATHGLIGRYFTAWSYNTKDIWLDESGATNYLYTSSDDDGWAFQKWDISDVANPVKSYTYNGGADFNGFVYIGQISGDNVFAVATELSTKELVILKDNGTAFEEIDFLDPGTFGSAGIISGGDNTVILYSTEEANLIAVDVTDPTNISTIITDTTSYPKTYATQPHHYAEYNATLGGFFFDTRDLSSSTTSISFIARPETRNTGSGYDNKRTITLQSSKIDGTSHSLFPILISETQTYLKTVTNGGKVKNDNGYDIIFTSDSDGTTILNHEIEKYSSSTGELVAWVSIPTLSGSTDTDIYMFYGNSTVQSSQERVNDLWSEYSLVMHMGDFQSDEIRGSAAGGNVGIKKGDSDGGGNMSTQVAGVFGYAQSFDGTGYIDIAQSSSLEEGTSDFTAEVWWNSSSSGTEISCPFYKGNANTADNDGWHMCHYVGYSQKLYFHMGDSNTTNLGGMYTNNAITDDVWTYAAIAVDRNVGYQYYIDGNTDSSYTIDSSVYSIGELYGVSIGRHAYTNQWFLFGKVDEVRLSTTLRDANWISTTYNNLNSTSTFYSIGSEGGTSGFSSPGVIYSSIFDLGSTDKEIKNVIVEQNVPSGCDLDITVEVSNDIGFPVNSISSEVFSDSSSSKFTSSTLASLNGKRWMRYKADLTSCNSNAEAPTLYSVKFNYR